MEKEQLHMERLEKTAFRLGLAGIIATFLFPLFLPCLLGSTAIILALLSRGGSRKFSRRGRQALILGTVAVVLNIVYVAYAAGTVLSMLNDPAGRQQISDIMYKTYGLTLEEFLGQLGVTP